MMLPLVGSIIILCDSRDLTLHALFVRTKRNCRTRLNLNFRLARDSTGTRKGVAHWMSSECVDDVVLKGLGLAWLLADRAREPGGIPLAVCLQAELTRLCGRRAPVFPSHLQDRRGDSPSQNPTTKPSSR